MNQIPNLFITGAESFVGKRLIKHCKDKKISYNERKKLSICYTKQLLENKNMLSDLTYFTKHSKKDDLADCLLQGIYYLDNKQECIKL